jgi:hypothetical protein
MLIQSGNVRSLAGRQWAAVELSTEGARDDRMEEIVVSIIRWAAARKQAFQLLFPVEERGLGGIKLLSPYLYARTKDLRALNNITGAVFKQRARISVLRDTTGAMIPLEDSFVQEVAERCRLVRRNWSKGIRPGSFVRVLLGSQRMLCGKVTGIDGDRAVVDVSLRLRRLKLTIPVGALENLGMRRKEYYYNGNLS